MKIGFVGNIYATPKGHSYVIKDMVKILKDAGHEVHMYRILDNTILPDFPMPDSLETEPTRIIPEDKFRKWLDDIKPDCCVFMEYCQWWEEDHDKVEICRDLGIKTVGFLIYEKLNWDKIDHYKNYTKLIAPTGFQTKVMRQNGLYNTVHVPWGVDKQEIDAVKGRKENPPKVVFFHCAGSGGVGDRKNTKAIIDAYKKIDDGTTELRITHLNSKVFSREDIISFMKYADVLLNASKWDTLGLNTLEANMCGKPVIVSNTDPMTELVKENINGFCVDGKETTFELVTCPSYEVDVEQLAQKMTLCKNRLILETMQRNARKFAETNFDWEKNKKYLLKVFEE